MKYCKSVHEEDFELMKWFTPKKEQIYLDVGSNRGEALTSMSIMNKFKTNIVGFEPNIEVYNRLYKYISKNKNIKIHNVGIGETSRNSKLYVPFYRNWMFDGLASFSYENAKEWLYTRMYFFNEKKLTIKETDCKIKTLDEYNFNPYFIKIDVQGLELEVLRGAASTIKKYHPILLIESLDNECINYLAPQGYDFFYYNNKKLYKGLGELNTFCINRNKNIELEEIISK